MRRFTLLALLVTSLVASPVRAALPAFDNAADPAYDNGWTDGSNGGVGFDPWAITTNNDNINNFAGTFIGDAGASEVKFGHRYACGGRSACFGSAGRVSALSPFMTAHFARS